MVGEPTNYSRGRFSRRRQLATSFRSEPLACARGRSVDAGAGQNGDHVVNATRPWQGRLFWGVAALSAVLALGGAVIIAAMITAAQQESLPSFDSPGIPVGVFMTPADGAALASASAGLEWTTRVYVNREGFSVGLGLARASDPYSSTLRQSLDYEADAGELNSAVTVVLVLPPSEAAPANHDGAVSQELKDLLDTSSELSPWGGKWCAQWTLADGTTAGVRPTIDANSWRMRAICEVPAIGRFTALRIGTEVSASVDLSLPHLVGRGAITLFELNQPFITSDDLDAIDDAVVPVAALRLIAIAYGGVTLEGSSGSSGIPGFLVTEFGVGDYVPLVVVDQTARTNGQTIVQVMWVLVGLLGGWVGIAGYRAVTWTAEPKGS